VKVNQKTSSRTILYITCKFSNNLLYTVLLSARTINVLCTAYGRVTIRRVLSGQVLCFSQPNSVQEEGGKGFFNFTKMSEFCAFVDIHTQFFGGCYVHYNSQFSQTTFQLQNLFLQLHPVVPNACLHTTVPGAHFELCVV
jgi:hypothetical protein